MTSTGITENTIRAWVSGEIFLRGLDYYEQGAVLSVELRENQLTAEVQGSDIEPYQVRITLESDDITDAECSCPYDWGGYCKHVVAALLTCMRDGDRVERRPPTETVLEDLDEEQLRTLVLKMVERQPRLANLVESIVLTLESGQPAEASSDASPRQRPTSIDPSSIRRQVLLSLHSLDHMRSSEAYWQVGSVVNEIRRLLEQPSAAIEADDAENAIALLEALTEEYVKEWITLDDSDGEASEFFRELGEVWTEALLTADLASEEREDYAERLALWQEEVDGYGVDEAFHAAIAAAVQGWDYPPLQRVLQGEITEKGAWDGEAPWYADELTIARLNVLERQGRTQEYLYLAEAESQIEQYVTMLVKLRRISDAVNYGLTYLATADEALALAIALSGQGETESALRIAEHGWSLQGSMRTLGRWLRDAAANAGQSELALQAAIVACREGFALEDYLAVEPLAGPQWPQVKADMLGRLSAFHYTPAKIEIYLREGIEANAIKAVDEAGRYIEYRLLERVVDAAGNHPDWAIAQCRRQAEQIMDEGQSGNYIHAVRWLSKAKDVYLATGRQAEWQNYLQGLLSRHSRKYRLIPMLKSLG